jgi:hypothetical protein
MAELDLLRNAYASQVSTPWREGLSGAERVWFLVYSPASERRLRHRLQELEIATREAGHGWTQLDITDIFPQWMASQKHVDGFFKRPDALVEQKFVEAAAEHIKAALRSSGTKDVLAVTGVGTLFGLTPLSAVMKHVDEAVQGRLLICFPGNYEREFHRYRLLGTGEGWSYLAVPIVAERGLNQ